MQTYTFYFFHVNNIWSFSETNICTKDSFKVIITCYCHFFLTLETFPIFNVQMFKINFYYMYHLRLLTVI